MITRVVVYLQIALLLQVCNKKRLILLVHINSQSCGNAISLSGKNLITKNCANHYQYMLVCDIGFAPIFPDTCYHLTHYWLAAVDIPVASDNPVHYADAIRYNARTPLQGSLLPLTRLVWA